MSETIQILTEFKRQLVKFFDELISQFPNEGDLVICRILVNDQLDIEHAIEQFIVKLDADNGEMRTMVKEKNDAFFIERDIWQTISQDTGTRMKKIWCSTQVTDDDRDVIWQWFASFVYLSDRYHKSKIGSTT